jgi:hypothetical protein
MTIQMRYILRDANAKLALMDLREHMSIPDWMHTHAALFKSISIRPDGYPSIADANYGNVRYVWIQEFHRMYVSLREFMAINFEDPND